MAAIKKKDIIAKFVEIVGKEKAESLISEGIQSLNLGNKEDYNQDEVLRISEFLKQKGGMIKIVASCLASDIFMLKK